MPIQPSQSWSPLKTQLQYLDQGQLPLFRRDLYALNADNKGFLASRFLAATPEELTAPYRRIICQVCDRELWQSRDAKKDAL